MPAPMHAQNFSMSFTSFSSGSAPANLNSSSKGYQFVSTAPVVHQNKHEMEAVQLMSRTQKRITEDPINECNNDGWMTYSQPDPVTAISSQWKNLQPYYCRLTIP
ncbi:hypothetical protein F2Q70_00035052 [Brassica cretica]|uniref:Uncharacterized protein n=1 Tax=Brassica cretica TaxID=69181 RepID=A0A8S9JV80_BRACR|nr:hypothetical protein F2Q70_00035052 [Brassica cretica]